MRKRASEPNRLGRSMDEFSQRTAREIFASFPEWEALSTCQTWKGSEPFLVVTIPPPAEANTDLPLRISTWDEEVTVDFDYYHTHFNKWMPEEGDGRHDAALLYVRDLLEEKMAVVSWWQDDLCKSCGQYVPGAELKPTFNIHWTAARVRSWKGSVNADIKA
jgi:hypothetical protein